MLHRRSLLLLGPSLLVGETAIASADDSTTAPTSANPPKSPSMTITEELMYSTVRLQYVEGATTKWGTGFFYNFFLTNDSHVPAIVTNKHVLEGMKACTFRLASTNDDGSPNLSSHIDVEMPNFETAWIPHPSADLAIIPLARKITELSAATKKPFIRTVNQSFIPTTSEFQEFTPVERVLTLGFPGAIWDDVHNLPIFHRGYTASPPYIDFKGKAEFLLDFTTWPGASGSMVLLYNDQGWIDRKGNTFLGTSRIKLIGIVYGVGTQDVSGNVIIQNGPVSLSAQVTYRRGRRRPSSKPAATSDCAVGPAGIGWSGAGQSARLPSTIEFRSATQSET